MTTITIPKISRRKIRLDRFAGEWVALLEDKVIAHSDELKVLMQKLDKEGLRKKSSVFLVPRKDEGPYVLILL